MSKRAEQKANEAYPDIPLPHLGKDNIARQGHLRGAYIEGYEQAEEDFIALVKQYIEKGERCMEQEGESQIYAFWDGFHNCAENILRELEGE